VLGGDALSLEELHAMHEQNNGSHVSPREGTDISPDRRPDILSCGVQSTCIVPQLQLQRRFKIYFCRNPALHGTPFTAPQQVRLSPGPATGASMRVAWATGAASTVALELAVMPVAFIDRYELRRAFRAYNRGLGVALLVVHVSGGCGLDSRRWGGDRVQHALSLAGKRGARAALERLQILAQCLEAALGDLSKNF
jgi:hypothetical protein